MKTKDQNLKLRRVISIWQLSYEERIKLLCFVLYSLNKRAKSVKSLQESIEKQLSMEIPIHTLVDILLKLKAFRLAFKVSTRRWKTKGSFTEEDLKKVFSIRYFAIEEPTKEILKGVVFRLKSLHSLKKLYMQVGGV